MADGRRSTLWQSQRSVARRTPATSWQQLGLDWKDLEHFIEDGKAERASLRLNIFFCNTQIKSFKRDHFKIIEMSRENARGLLGRWGQRRPAGHGPGCWPGDQLVCSVPTHECGILK